MFGPWFCQKPTSVSSLSSNGLFCFFISNYLSSLCLVVHMYSWLKYTLTQLHSRKGGGGINFIHLINLCEASCRQRQQAQDSTAKLRWSWRAKQCWVSGWYSRKGDRETQCLIRMEVSYKRRRMATGWGEHLEQGESLFRQHKITSCGSPNQGGLFYSYGGCFQIASVSWSGLCFSDLARRASVLFSHGLWFETEPHVNLRPLLENNADVEWDWMGCCHMDRCRVLNC